MWGQVAKYSLRDLEWAHPCASRWARADRHLPVGRNVAKGCSEQELCLSLAATCQVSRGRDEVSAASSRGAGSEFKWVLPEASSAAGLL